MNEIKRIESYKYNGKIYNSLNEIQEEVENQIGQIVDSFDVVSAGDRIRIFEGIIKNKEQLVKLLTVVFDVADDDYLCCNMKNILDI